MTDSSNLRAWSASDIGVREHGRWLFQHVSAEAARGELVSIVADPGAARGTLALALSGRLRPTEGTIAFSGEPLGAGRVSHRSAIGWLAGMRLYEDRARCREIVGQAYRLSRTPKAQRDVDELLRTAGLTGPGAVATDLREIDKAALGAAVLRALRPEVAFVDVPASSPAARDGLAASIRSLREEGSIVVVLHHEAWPGATKTVLVGDEAQGDADAVVEGDAETRPVEGGTDATAAQRPDVGDAPETAVLRTGAPDAPAAEAQGTDGEGAPTTATDASGPEHADAPSAEAQDIPADEAPQHPTMTRRQRHGRA